MLYLSLGLYNALLLLLYPVYMLLALFHPKARTFYNSRKDGAGKLVEFLREKKTGRRVFWLHGSSVGELDQALGLLREIRQREDALILLSAFSLSVKRTDHPEADLFFHLPVDFPFVWRWILRDFRPDFFVTMTWDVFPNLLFHLKNKKTRCYIGSAALSESSHRIKAPFRFFYRPIYNLLSGIGCADAENREYFLRLLPDEKKVIETGDSRYDTIFYKLENTHLAKGDVAIFKNQKKIWILASTYDACDQEIFPSLAQAMKQNPQWMVYNFPHHIDAHRIAELEDNARASGIRTCRLTEKKPRENSMIIVDRMGILALAYKFADFCYVGGAFHNRVHNTAEGAALGLPVLTGPRIETSPAALALKNAGALFSFENGRELVTFATAWMQKPREIKKIGQKASRAMLSRKGGSRRFYESFLVEAKKYDPAGRKRRPINAPEKG